MTCISAFFDATSHGRRPAISSVLLGIDADLANVRLLLIVTSAAYPLKSTPFVYFR